MSSDGEDFSTSSINESGDEEPEYEHQDPTTVDKPDPHGILPPAFAVNSEELAEGLSDAFRIRQAYNFVSSRLSREDAEEYDLDVSHLVFGSEASYKDFWISSRFNALHLPQGEKPATRGDRRRKRARLPEPEWQRCPSCGATLCDEFVDGESLLCDCGLVLREGDREAEVGFIERENYEHRTNSIYKKPSKSLTNPAQSSRVVLSPSKSDTGDL